MPHHVVAGALIGPLGILLVHRRQDRRYYPDCWDFPGGHVEEGETPADALARELREEIGCVVNVAGEPRLHIVEDESSPDGLDLTLWVLTEWAGVPANLAVDEHDDLRWVSAFALSSMQLAHPAYAPLLRELTTTR